MSDRKRLIFHIGMPKTGTTTIQKTLVENTEALSANRIRYPEFGLRFGAHHLLVDPFVTHENPYVPAPEMPAEAVVAEILSWADDPDHDTVIISSEAFASGLGFRAAMRELAEAFRIHVVLMLREQVSYANSLLGQMLKMKLFRPDEGGGFQHSLVQAANVRSYVEIARLWRDGVPDGHLTVVPFTRGGDVWDGFARAVGGLDGVMANRERRNAALRPEALAFIFWFIRREREVSPRERARIASMLEDYSVQKARRDPGPVILLDPAVQRFILSHAEPVNAVLSEEFFDGRTVFEAPPEARFVDVGAIGQGEVILEVADYVLGRYDRHVTFLKAGK